jgi:hypothetical protein
MFRDSIFKNQKTGWLITFRLWKAWGRGEEDRIFKPSHSEKAELLILSQQDNSEIMTDTKNEIIRIFKLRHSSPLTDFSLHLHSSFIPVLSSDFIIIKLVVYCHSPTPSC